MTTTNANTFHTESRMRRILRPRRLHFEPPQVLREDFARRPGGSSSCDISESFHLRALGPMPSVTLSETGSGEVPLSHRDRPFALGDPYRASPPSHRYREAPLRRQEEETTVSKHPKMPLLRGAFPVAINTWRIVLKKSMVVFRSRTICLNLLCPLRFRVEGSSVEGLEYSRCEGLEDGAARALLQPCLADSLAPRGPSALFSTGR